ncbi:type-1 angiotensin II receptor [Denticeps clupeoides]|uniref:Type-1 angiotensin II receptor n=1 Tax=Denticeps clupeoides TaxID=299321 RepID=A0AAY4AEV6_9TELE|nr:type-1 angiotensin II receptor-like [Denticeps clupeoides]
MENVSGSMLNPMKLDCNMTGSHSFIFTIIPVAYSCTFVIGIVGNSMVVAVIHYCAKLKTVANIFVLNLAVSDLIFLTMLPVWAKVTASGYHWPFGSFLCKVSAGLALFNFYTSIFFLTALSIDRYLAIARPVESRRCRTVHYAQAICVVVWVASLLLSLPAALIRDTIPIEDVNVTVCAIHSDDPGPEVALNLMKNILGFLVPLAIVLTCYCLIGRALLGAGRHLLRSSRSNGDEVLRMLTAAVLAFFFCWCPHQVFSFLYLLVQFKVMKSCHALDVIDTALPFTVCVAYFNSCINPVLYSFVGKNFRRSLLRLLRCSVHQSSASHPNLSTKLSTLSCRASEDTHSAAGKTTTALWRTGEEPREEKHLRHLKP